MKILPILTTLIVSLATASATNQVLVQHEWIEVDSVTLNELMFGNKLQQPAKDHRAKLEKLITKKEAHVVLSSGLLTQLGTSSRTRNTRHSIYPTEYDPPETYPNKVDSNGKVITKGYHFDAHPTAFEERPIGITIEQHLSQVNGDSSLLLADFDIESVQQISPRVFQSRQRNDFVNTLYMPTFLRWTTKSKVKLKYNTLQLIGIVRGIDQKGQVKANKHVIQFVKVIQLNPAMNK